MARKPQVDPQERAVAVLERMEFRGLYRKGSHTPLKQLRLAAKLVCKLYRVPRCTVFVRKTRGYRALYWYEPHVSIQLDPEYGHNLFTLAHELAHHVVDYRHRRSQAHGATFVRVFGEVLDVLRMVPLAGFKAACKKRGVRIARRPRCF